MFSSPVISSAIKVNITRTLIKIKTSKYISEVQEHHS